MIALQKKYRENHWISILNKVYNSLKKNPGGGTSEILSIYEGMGSFSDGWSVHFTGDDADTFNYLRSRIYELGYKPVRCQ
ncbi:MAG: hypothetical protein JXK07_00785 [Spirochaetes bacterium]|nr:hypothetical protein [Spirochaetota bacterium]MBN2771679.1 hypothetical protein [Spirochaetota bacterium]